MLNSVLSILLEAADALCPLREYNITHQRPVYFTNELVELIKEHHTILRMAVRKKDKGYWERGVNLRKTVTRYIKEAKKSFILEKIKTHKNNSKKYWKSIQLVLPNTRYSSIDVIYDPEADEIVSGVSAANVINDDFANIGKNLAMRLPKSNKEFWPKHANIEFVWDRVITPSDISYFILKISAHRNHQALLGLVPEFYWTLSH